MSAEPPPDPAWSIVERWQEFAGETRANLLRASGIAGFYLIELVNYHGLRLGPLQLAPVAGVDRGFHSLVTALAVAWVVAGCGVLILLRRRLFSPMLKYLSTGLDLCFLTAVLAVADGPASPLAVAYFLVPPLAALRFSLPLVRFAAGGAMAGYLVLLGQARWLRPEMRVPPYQQLIFLLALGLTGVLLGQMVRRAREAAQDYAARLAQARERSA